MTEGHFDIMTTNALRAAAVKSTTVLKLYILIPAKQQFNGYAAVQLIS